MNFWIDRYRHVTNIFVILRSIKDLDLESDPCIQFCEDKAMTKGLQEFPSALGTEASLAAKFFRTSVGHWLSERRYYTLPEGDTQEEIGRASCRERVLMPV